ncbi:MAG TPA: UbiA family prenyltransferase [Amycolatopsis sp.]|uniref:UbiA family prenyltransferase n=1 Tax=Amycolatopsis sp. TaxID=37632 RepID=UPI002B45BB51|nr:UbiA family prenyltransferase [Amycolatopsis sp.]HKS46535.1 UbiA family prenyltransferase [Amycolatopsis sp.]
MPRLASWPDLVVVHRLQFPLPVNYLCYAVWGCGFATGDAARILEPAVLAAILANLLLIIGPLALNVAIDMPTDTRHADKGYLAIAAARLGRRRALALSWTEMALGLLTTAGVGLGRDRWWPLAIAAAIVGAQVLYNVEPVRLKRRGLLGSTAFGVASVGFPALLGYTATGTSLDTTVWLIFTGAAVLSVGRTVWWAIPDHAADAETGVMTPAVRCGPVRALGVACLLLQAGLFLLGWGLWRRYGPVWSVLGLAVHALFLGRAIRQLSQTARRNPPTAGVLLRRTLPVVTLGEVVLTVIAFAA